MSTTQNSRDYAVKLSEFDLAKTLDCGQCFRFDEGEDGIWSGIAPFGLLKMRQEGENVTFFDTDRERYEKLIAPYLDLDTDYAAIRDLLCADPTLAAAAAYACGIRIMRQQPWETLCSFIISQNNNIARIKGIISRLCEGFGEKTEGGYAFPTAERLAALEPADLAPLRAGFRDKYIIDAARKVASGEVDFEKVAAAGSDDARAELEKIKGVGDKVADCALLFGFHRLEAFPRDVWIKRAMAALFPQGLPQFALPYAGVAQQYIFHYARTSDIFNKAV